MLESVLWDDVDTLVVLIDFVNFDYVGVVESSRDLDFVHEHIDVLDLSLLYLFDGSPGALCPFDASLVHSPEGSFAQFLNQLSSTLAITS